MSEIIATTSQQAEQTPIVTLFEINLTSKNQGVFRFCNSIDFDQPVKYNGYDYLPLPIEAEGFSFSGQGTIKRPTLRLSTVDISIRSLVVKTKLTGMPIKRIRIHSDNLDNGDDPNPFATYVVDYYVIDRRTSQTKDTVEFELTSEFDQEGKKIPGWDILKNACTHIYRTYNEDTGQFDYEGVTCPYMGTEYLDSFGETVFEPSNDICGKRLRDCQERFGYDKPLPFKGFPGVLKR